MDVGAGSKSSIAAATSTISKSTSSGKATSSPGRATTPPRSTSPAKVVIDPEQKVSPKPVVPEPKLLPRPGSIRDPKPPQQFLPPKTASGVLNVPPVVPSPKNSMLSIDVNNASKTTANALTTGLATSPKSPPPLPPRKLSPRIGEGSKKTPDIGDSSSISAVENKTLEPSAEETKINKAEDVKANSGHEPGSRVSRKSSIAAAPAITEEKKKGGSITAPAASPKNDPIAAVKTDELRSQVAPWTVWADGPEKTLANDELRSNIAPWTVWADGPENTLANEELRSQVAPWTTEPESEPTPNDRRESSAALPSPREAKTIAMDKFFTSGDGSFGEGEGEEEEFVNPLLNTQNNDDEEEMISKPSITKKTWIASGARPVGSQAASSKSQPPGPIVEKKPEAKKVIDYGEVFKAPAHEDDDDNPFLNDPEFANAPDFEW